MLPLVSLDQLCGKWEENVFIVIKTIWMIRMCASKTLSNNDRKRATFVQYTTSAYKPQYLPTGTMAIYNNFAQIFL